MTIQAEASSVSSIVDRVKGILLTPKAEWAKIIDEPTSVGGLFKGYAVILAAIGADLQRHRLHSFWLGCARICLPSPHRQRPCQCGCRIPAWIGLCFCVWPDYRGARPQFRRRERSFSPP